MCQEWKQRQHGAWNRKCSRSTPQSHSRSADSPQPTLVAVQLVLKVRHVQLSACLLALCRLTLASQLLQARTEQDGSSWLFRAMHWPLDHGTGGLAG